METDIAYLTAIEIRDAYKSKQLSPIDVAKGTLARLEATEPKINAFVTVTGDLLNASAKEAERRIMAGEDLRALEGIPLSVKDVIPVKDVRLTSGTKAMADNIAPIDAPVVERVKEAGAGIVGKTTASEFGCKAVGDSPLTGITRNPWDLSRTSGGSSAGAVASVAAGVTPLAIATDGGGSIRIPCSMTGLFGIKPQFARVPMFPASAAPTLGHVGAIARTVRDAALMLGVESANDTRDPFSVAEPVPDYLAACERSPKGLRVAWSPTLGYGKPRPDVVDVCAKAAKAFEGLGCEVEEVDHIFDDPFDMFEAEFYAGIGTRLKPVLEQSAEILDPAVREILTNALNQDILDYYTKVFRRYDLREQIRGFFDTYDLLLTPVLPTTAPPVGYDMPPDLDDPTRGVVSWVYYTYPFNLTGQPAASIPAGYATDNMPVGLQIVGRINREVDIFSAAAAFEAEYPWADNRPAIDLAEAGE